uniref:DOMON domain-containing protein n=1 Tax=Acrobeloides nanus TaxID=290746 RepID=A0A914D9L2_9BILA
MASILEVVALFVVMFLRKESVAQNFSTSECGNSKGCLFQPNNCIPFQTCAYAMSYSATNSGDVIFEILGQVTAPYNTYVALGFNNAAQMDGATVTACASYNGSPFLGRLTYNPATYNLNVPIDQNTQSNILQTIYSGVVNNTLYCKVTQTISPPSNIPSNFVAPLNQTFYILMVSGPTQTGNNPALLKHSTHYISPQMVNLL